MKVALLTRYFLPVRAGIENHCYNLAREMLNRGIEANILTSRDTLTRKGKLSEKEIIDGIRVLRYKNFWKVIPKGYDIIHLHNFNVFPHCWIFLSILIKRILKVKTPKIIVTLHGGFTPNWKEFPIITKLIKKVYHSILGRFFLNYLTDRIIAVSEWEKEKLIENGVSKDKIIIIPNGVENYAYVLPKVKSSILEEYKPYLLFIGRISPRKGIDFAIKCLKEEEINKVKLLIAGTIHDKQYYKYLKSLIIRLNLKERVIFLGVVDEKFKYELMDNALAVILMSHYEVEGIVLKEAIVRGKPVIVNNIRSLKDLVKDGENGFLVSSEKEFIEAVKILLNESDIVTKISAKNLEMGKKWSWNLIGGKILEIYGAS